MNAPLHSHAHTVNPDVPVRHMNFGFDEKALKRYFYDDNAFASTYFMAFSAVIPQGERFFIDSVRHFRKHITDPGLQARVAGFIGQEAMHGKEHDAVNKAYNRMGFPIRAVDRSTHAALRYLQRRLPAAAQLAITAAAEHYTAIISEHTIRHPEMQAKFAEGIREFLLWHMMEETEHKAVAFDVYEQTVGSYALRAGIMVPVTIGLIGGLFVAQLAMLRRDRQKQGWRQTLKGIGAIYGPGGIYLSVLPRMLDYFKPGFHPNQHDTDAILQALRERLFGADGELKAEHIKTIRPKQADLSIKALA